MKNDDTVLVSVRVPRVLYEAMRKLARGEDDGSMEKTLIALLIRGLASTRGVANGDD